MSDAACCLHPHITLKPGCILTFCALQAYAKLRLDVPELADLTSAAAMDETVTVNGKGAKRQRIYEDHLPESEITAGLKRGTLHQARSWLSYCGRQVLPEVSC